MRNAETSLFRWALLASLAASLCGNYLLYRRCRDARDQLRVYQDGALTLLGNKVEETVREGAEPGYSVALLDMPNRRSLGSALPYRAR